MALDAPAGSPDAEGIRTATSPADLHTVVPRAKVTRVVSAETNIKQRLAEVWRSRELLIFLVRTEIKVKYKNSFLGLLWSMVSPALTLLVFTIVFGSILKSGMPNFVIFLFSGLLLWNFFQTGVMAATGVVVNNAGLVKKVSFPREILALASIGSAGVFFFFQTIVLVIFMAVLRTSPAWSELYLFLAALIPAIVLACALGIFFAAVNVYMRDTQHLVTVLVGAAWFWGCPIVYSYQLQVMPLLKAHHLTWLFFANPMTPLIMTFQRVIYNRPGTVQSTTPTHAMIQVLPPWPVATYLLADAAVLVGSLLLFYFAMIVFGRLAGNFAEEL